MMSHHYIMIILLLSLGEKQYEEGPLAGKKLPKPVQLLGFLLTGATVVGIIIFFMFVFFNSSFQNLRGKVQEYNIFFEQSLPSILLELLPTEVFGHIIRRQVRLIWHSHPIKSAEGHHQGFTLQSCSIKVVPGENL